MWMWFLKGLFFIPRTARLDRNMRYCSEHCPLNSNETIFRNKVGLDGLGGSFVRVIRERNHEECNMTAIVP